MPNIFLNYMRVQGYSTVLVLNVKFSEMKLYLLLLNLTWWHVFLLQGTVIIYDIVEDIEDLQIDVK